MKDAKTTILKTIDEHKLLNEGDHLVLGLSGGPDSLCLFDVLCSIRDEMKLKIDAVHVNHKFRPGDAEEDQSFVEQICKERGIRCWAYEEDCRAIARELGLTDEEAGRKVRYDAFARVSGELVKEGENAEKIKIAVAQNLNDQAETLLFRILRGTGTDGLSGIEYLRRDRTGFFIIRPLLDVARDDVEEYCRVHELQPRIDKTNNESVYTRNKIRLELLPYLEENFNENIRDAINRLCKIAREDTDFIWKKTEEAWKEVFISNTGGVCSLNREVMKDMPPAIRHRIIMKAFSEVGLHRDISYTHLEQASLLIDKGKSSASIDFPMGYAFSVSYEKAMCAKAVDIIPEKPPQYVLKANILYMKDYVKKDNTAVFDVDKLAEVYDFAGGPLSMIFARTREPGDFMALSVGHKTIQDLFVDMKVPKNLRDNIYMAAIGNEILWIPEGVSRARFSDNYAVTDETAKVLILEMSPELC
ncbi:MAG: tRNA lysidine(34) synthetase TilS [Eubacteriaceae bacterium]|nr:tRNA lysidine(34) synthetase TilS [Eubacteriaceae bacterium]